MTPRDTVTVWAGKPRGRVVIPPSKSIAHRALICAALCPRGSVSRLSNMPCNEDIDATVDCLTALGVRITQERGEDNTRTLTVEGCGGEWPSADNPLGCRESGSTLRFMLPLCLLSPIRRILTGSERLLTRLYPLPTALAERREIERTPNGVVIAEGSPLGGGTYSLAKTVTSQWTTGLLFVLPLLEEDSVIEFATPPESRSYIDMTVAMLSRFGVTAVWQDETHLRVSGSQTYRPCDMTVDGDASGAAFFHALKTLHGGDQPFVVCPRSEDVVQGDAVCERLLNELKHGDAPIISLADCPDLGPVLFAAAAAMRGGVFTHTDRLRVKESDRVAAMVQELSKFGVRCDVLDGEAGGTVVVHPSPDGLQTPSGVLHGHNDHRIVMSLAVLSTCLAPASTVTIDDAHAVAKSFPDFFDRLRSLGIDCRQN